MKGILSRLLVLGLTIASCTSRSEATPIAMPDWDQAIAATRQIAPVQLTVEVLLEVNEQPAGGTALTGVADWERLLADLTPYEPITNTPLSRVILNGDTSYVLSSNDAFLAALPAGREIVSLPTGELVAAGLVSDEVEAVTGVLGLLRGATSAARQPDGDIEVQIDLGLALDRMSDTELRGIRVDLSGIEPTAAFGELRLRDDQTIERFMVRIEADRNGDEYLLNGTSEFAPVDTPLTFEPPPADKVVDIDDVPRVRALLTP